MAKNNDKILIYIGAACLALLAAIFVGYSYVTIERIEHTATSTGSSTNPNQATRPQDQRLPPANETSGTSNVPPAKAPSR